MSLDLPTAQKIISAALAHARANNMKPMGIGIIDARGALVAYAAEDGSALKRSEIALGKARGAIGFGIGSRALMKRAEQQPTFITTAALAIGPLIPVPGGVLIKDSAGTILGAAGMSGDTSDNDEAAALAGITAGGLIGDGG